MERQIPLGFHGNKVLSSSTYISSPKIINLTLLPSWAKQINSEVGITPFITGTDVLKAQSQNK